MMRRSPIRRRSRLRPRSQRSVETRALDALLRRIVLLRDGHKCRRCGEGPRHGRGFALQAAHIRPKGAYPALRWETSNVICLCAYCHVYGKGAWHKDPAAAAAWALEHLGREYLDRLEFMAQTRRKVDRAAVKVFLELELKRLEAA